MSTIKSSAENLTLNADGANNDIIFQSNGSNVATLDQAGLFTATSFAGSGASLTALPAAQLTGTLPAISGANLTGVGVAGITSSADATAITIDSAENVGLGTTPKTTSSTYTNLQVGGTGTVLGYKTQVSGSDFILGNNVYYNSGFKRMYNEQASMVEQLSGTMNLKVSAAGSADSAITWTTAMNISNAGIVTKPKQPAFAARYSSDQTGNWNGEWFIPDTPTVNTGSHYNASNGRFYAPVAGNYFFSVNMRMNSRGGAYWYVDILKNGTTHHRVLNDADDSYDFLALSGVIPMAANDYVQAKINTVGDTSSAVSGESSFSGFLIG